MSKRELSCWILPQIHPALVEKGTFFLCSKALAAVQAWEFPQHQDLTEYVQQKVALSVPAQKTFFQACA